MPVDGIAVGAKWAGAHMLGGGGLEEGVPAGGGAESGAAFDAGGFPLGAAAVGGGV